MFAPTALHLHRVIIILLVSKLICASVNIGRKVCNCAVLCNVLMYLLVYKRCDVPTPNYTELDVDTPNYQDPESPSSTPPSATSSVEFTPPTQVEFQQQMLPHKAFLNVAHFFMSVYALAALIMPLDPSAICTGHLPICLWGYEALLAMLSSKLRIVTTGINGSASNRVFDLWTSCVRTILQTSAIGVAVEDICLLLWLAYTYFWSSNVHQYFTNYRYGFVCDNSDLYLGSC